MNGNQGGLDLFGEQVPQGEHATSSEPSPEDFLFSQQPSGTSGVASVLTTTTTPAFGMPLGRYAMPEPAPSDETPPPRAQASGPVQRKAVPHPPVAPLPAGAQPLKSALPVQAPRRNQSATRRPDPVPVRARRPKLQSLLLVGIVLITSLGFASWIATEFGEYVLGGLAAVMGVVGAAFTWVLSNA